MGPPQISPDSCPTGKLLLGWDFPVGQENPVIRTGVPLHCFHISGPFNPVNPINPVNPVCFEKFIASTAMGA